MLNTTSFPIKFITVVGSVVMLSSCAPTTRSFQGTTETFANTSDASTDFTSSTSPRSEKDSQAQKVRAFATVNFDRLREDMARGNGEHLAAFAHLLGIREARQAEFFALTKQRYPVLFSSEPTTPETMLARLDTELTRYPGWRQ